MSGTARSRVNLHISNCRDLAGLATQGLSQVITSSFCLQFELALGFYLMELLQTVGKKSGQLWPVSRESLAALVRQFESADLRELHEIAIDGGSWASRTLKRLELLRQVESIRAIRGDIFQSDLESPVANRLIATSSDNDDPGFDLNLLLSDLDAFEALVVRQRLGHEEY